MLRPIYFLILFLLLQSSLFGLNVTIIESQILPDASNADLSWSEVVSMMGHTPSIVPYSTLDNTLFFSTTDLLIVSSGITDLSSIAVKNILTFIKTGKSVYLQCEYLPDFTTNIAFREIVIELGGSFAWDSLFSGDIDAMNVLGTYGTTPNQVSSLDYFHYSVSGIGDCNMINFLEFGGAFHGFHYIPDNPAYGTIATTSDEDWGHHGDRPDFMENILYHLLFPSTIPVAKKVSLGRDISLCIGESVLLQPIPLDANYEWQDGSIGPDYITHEEGIYWVTIKIEGCDVTDSVFVNVENCDCPVFTPNTFSPNNDNVNDEFSAISSCGLLDFSMLIYNRWGELIFQTNDQYSSWDGKVDGEDAPTGVYAYLIQYKSGDGERKNTYGDVTLIR